MPDVNTNGSVYSSYDIIPVAAAVALTTVHSVAVTENWKWVLTGTNDGRISKWDFFASLNGKTPLTQIQRSNYPESILNAGHLLSHWYLHESKKESEPILSPVYSLAMHSEALWCLAGSQSGSISLFSVRHDEGTRVTTLDSHTSVVSCLVLDKEEQTCFSGSWDSKIMHWDLNTGTPIRVYSEHPSQVSCIRLHPKDPNLFSSCSISGSCFQWDIRAPEPITRFPLNSPPWCLSICYHVDGTQLMIGKRNSAVEIYTLDMQLINKLKLPPNSGPVSKVHCMDNGRSLLIGSSDNLRLWDLNYTGKHIPFTILAGHSSGNVSDLIVDSQSRFMISANGNIFTSSWDVNTAKVIPQCFFYIISSVY